MPSKKVLTPIISGATYHIFNRGNNYEKVFFCDRDYKIFLQKFATYVYPLVDLYAYTLLPNHYHFLLSIKDHVIPKQFSNQFKNFILSYTYAINKRESRVGNIFHSQFKRLRVEQHSYLQQLVAYIHLNPFEHKCCTDFKNYRFSSYKSIISNKKTLLSRDEVLEWFEDRENFIYFHHSQMNIEMQDEWVLE